MSNLVALFSGALALFVATVIPFASGMLESFASIIQTLN